MIQVAPSDTYRISVSFLWLADLGEWLEFPWPRVSASNRTFESLATKQRVLQSEPGEFTGKLRHDSILKVWNANKFWAVLRIA